MTDPFQQYVDLVNLRKEESPFPALYDSTNLSVDKKNTVLYASRFNIVRKFIYEAQHQISASQNNFITDLTVSSLGYHFEFNPIRLASLIRVAAPNLWKVGTMPFGNVIPFQFVVTSNSGVDFSAFQDSINDVRGAVTKGFADLRHVGVLQAPESALSTVYSFLNMPEYRPFVSAAIVPENWRIIPSGQGFYSRLLSRYFVNASLSIRGESILVNGVLVYNGPLSRAATGYVETPQAYSVMPGHDRLMLQISIMGVKV